MNYTRKVTIGDATLYEGDCMDILPTLGKVDAVITDPPYGVNWVGCGGSTLEWAPILGDGGTLDLRHILNMPCVVFSFGASCYPEQLPSRGRWFCWDKRTIDGSCDSMIGAPIELAWSNKPSGFDKIVRVLHGGVVNADGGRRVHPTQKPIRVMAEAIKWCANDCKIILDPFMGSGTTGVAAIQLGRKFIGIEREPKYFDIACKRIEQAHAQGKLFAPEPPKQEQAVLV